MGLINLIYCIQFYCWQFSLYLIHCFSKMTNAKNVGAKSID